MISYQVRKISALGDIRVLDIADPIGLYGTKLLADLGADVIKIEPPGEATLPEETGPFIMMNHIWRRACLVPYEYQ